MEKLDPLITDSQLSSPDISRKTSCDDRAFQPQDGIDQDKTPIAIYTTPSQPDPSSLSVNVDSTSPDPTSYHFSIDAWNSYTFQAATRPFERTDNDALGFSFANLRVAGTARKNDYQKNVANCIISIADSCRSLFGGRRLVGILKACNGLVLPGEMLLVLGRPGSGCSTLLKTISGDVRGLSVAEDSFINYHGLTSHQMATQFRGEALYVAENDVHFPKLTVAQSLLFAAKARASRGCAVTGQLRSRTAYAKRMRDNIMAVFGLTQCGNTVVGNDVIKGISGGERRRVSIAEAVLSRSPIQCWDQATRQVRRRCCSAPTNMPSEVWTVQMLSTFVRL